ncbi:nuclear protein [Gonapodya sp. JEL0774]|nr:nuclear protein [Gonapodya sp. JEL0774]
MPPASKTKTTKDADRSSSKKKARRDEDEEGEDGDVMEMDDQRIDEGDIDKWAEQSAAEQREIRSTYRNMIEDLEENKDKYNKDLSNYVKKVEGANEQLESVQRPQEATLDARLMVGIAKEGSRIARAWQVQGISFDTDEFINLVALKAGAFGDDNEENQWKTLGKLGFKFSKRVPTTDFMVGALGKPPKEHVKKERKAAERQKPAIMEKAEQLSKADTSSDKNLVTKHVHSIFKHLKRAASANARDRHDHNDPTRFRPVCFFRFVTNPDPVRGFSQTVENLFYLAFLFKERKVGLEFDANDLPVLVVLDAAEDGIHADDDDGNPRPGAARAGQWQHLMDWTMEMWREAISAFDIHTPLIDSRAPVEDAGVTSYADMTDSSRARSAVWNAMAGLESKVGGGTSRR